MALARPATGSPATGLPERGEVDDRVVGNERAGHHPFADNSDVPAQPDPRMVVEGPGQDLPDERPRVVIGGVVVLPCPPPQHVNCVAAHELGQERREGGRLVEEVQAAAPALPR